MLRKRILIVCGLLMAAAGCETRVGDFTAMSTKNIYAKNVDITKLPRTEGCEGKKSWFLGIGLNLKDPLDMALESGHGNVMIDAAIYSENYIFVQGVRIKGTVVNVPYSGPAQPAAGASSGK